jgi:ketosteroid isomerase-like protein
VSIVEAEGHFARVAAQKGMRDAFIDFLSDDGIIFRPGPVNGKEWLLQQPATPGLLSWRPIYAEVARSNDLGYTTGPWELRPESPVSEGVTHGHYVSIWGRESDGEWRLLVDLGTTHDPPRVVPSEVEFGPGAAENPESVPTVDVESEKEALLGTDRLFSGNSADFGAVSAYMSFAAEDIRFYRMNVYPVKGKKEARKLLNAEPGLYTWEPFGAGVSRSGGLGYTYGSARLEVSQVQESETERIETPTGEVQHRSYLRIWRKDIDGNWNLTLDMSTPLPVASNEPQD